jgi:hypothetical protein
MENSPFPPQDSVILGRLFALAERLEGEIAKAPLRVAKEDAGKSPFTCYAFQAAAQGFQLFRLYRLAIGAGFHTSADPILRALVEVCIETAYVAAQTSRDKAAALALAQSQIDQYRQLKNIDPLHQRLPTLLATAQTAVDRYGLKLTGDHWDPSSGSLADRATKSGFGTLYQYAYRETSVVTHGSALANSMYVLEGEIDVERRLSETDMPVIAELWTACMGAHYCLVVIYEGVGIQHDDLDSIYTELTSIADAVQQQAEAERAS